MSQPPLLPPIQGHDPASQMSPYQQQPQRPQPQPQPQQQEQPQYAPPVMNGAQMHQQAPPTHHNTYAYQDTTHAQGSMPSNGLLNGQSQMRYALPPQQMDARQLSGGRQKKEIKRRTKTGCLTCRKRRIKVRKNKNSDGLYTWSNFALVPINAMRSKVVHG